MAAVAVTAVPANCEITEPTEATCDDEADNDCDGNGDVGGSPDEGDRPLDLRVPGWRRPDCLAACDAEANGSLGITDALRNLRHTFISFGEPAPPFPDCSKSDLTTDEEIGCQVPFRP